MPLYELGMVLNATLGDEERDAFVGEIRNLVTGEGGEIVKDDVWGKRTLAYEIDHQREGYYLFWQFEAPGGVVKPLEYKLRLSDQVLRYLVLNLDREMQRKKKLDRVRAERKAAKASKREAAASQAAVATEGA